MGFRSRGRAADLLVVAAVAAVAAATLFPTGDPSAGPAELCLLCGERGLADAILNVFLFVPLGAGLAARGTGARRAVLLGAAASLAVEVLQSFIPGRDPSAGDLVFNTLGTATGFWLVRTMPAWLRPSPGRARRLLAGGVLLPLLVLLAGGLLLRPWLPRGVYFGQWTAKLGHLEWYRGRVTAASVGDLPVPSHGMGRETGRLRALLFGGAPIRVSAVAGPPVARLAPLFSIYDAEAREILLVGPAGDDAVFQYSTLGNALRLDRPRLRFAGAFRDVRPGDPLSVSVERRGPRYCVQVNRARNCSLGFTVGDTWGVLIFPTFLSGAERRLVGLLWLAGLFAPAGLWIRGRRDALAGGAVVAAGLLAVPLAAGLLPTPAPQFLAALAGMGAGWAARRLVAGPPPAV